MFGINPAEWFINLPLEWAVFFLSMVPITELRAAIPIGIEVYGLPIWKVWIMAVLGDIIPAILILYFLPLLYYWLRHRRFLGKIITHQLEKAERKFTGKYEKYGLIGLLLFVGAPLPFTGSWTGSLAAVVFNIPFKKAFFFILLGVFMAASLVTLITLFAGGTLRWLF